MAVFFFNRTLSPHIRNFRVKSEECRGHQCGQYVQEKRAGGMTLGSMCKRKIMSMMVKFAKICSKGDRKNSSVKEQTLVCMVLARNGDR